MLSTIVEEARVKLARIQETSVDGPSILVAEAILTDPRKVRTLAINGGLVSNELRQIAWPYLLSERPRAETPERVKRDAKNEAETFKQIQLDVPRSANDEGRQFLATFLHDFFTKHDDLHFFQGFADVAWTVLQVMASGPVDTKGIAAAHFVLGRLSRDFLLRDAHRENFKAVYASLDVIHEIVRSCDKGLDELWYSSEATPYWAISPLVCLFTHDVADLTLKAKIMDGIIASEMQPELPIYMVASLVLLPEVKSKLKQDPDSSAMHQILLDAAKNEKYIEQLVPAAIALREKVPPRVLMTAAEASGVPKDCCLYRSIETSMTTMTKKRSWRTYSFFAVPFAALEASSVPL